MSLDAMKQALEALEQVQELMNTSDWFNTRTDALRAAIEQAEQSRQWQGLTDDEIIKVIHPLVIADIADEATDYEIARAIEAKLKEKNG